jgi:hypothetical protein
MHWFALGCYGGGEKVCGPREASDQAAVGILRAEAYEVYRRSFGLRWNLGAMGRCDSTFTGVAEVFKGESEYYYGYLINFS